MRKILYMALVAIISVTAAAPCAMADDDGFFKPGEEYKDVDFDIKDDEPITYVKTEGMVSYSDAADMEKAGILGALGIMGAYEDGMFKPNVYVSRADCVESLMKLFCLGYENEPASNGIFYDVDKNSEYYNLVYNAYDAGIVSGYSNNNFCPERVLSYPEAQMFAVKALGYGSLAENFGESYAKIFTDLKLNKGVSVKNAEALTRMELAGILYNVLNTPIMNMAHFNNNGTYEMKKDETPLYKLHNVLKSEGIITANRVTGYDGIGTGRNEVVINGHHYGIPSGLVNSYIGCNTLFWYDEDSDDILFIMKKKDINEITAHDRDIKSFDIRARKMVYDDGRKSRTVTFYENAPVFYNGVKLDGNYGLDLFDVKAGNIRMVSNSGNDAVFDAVFIESYDNYIISSSVTDKNTVRIFTDYDEGMLQFDPNETFVEIYDADGSYCEVYKTTDSGEEVTDISAVSKGKTASVYADNEGWHKKPSGRRGLTSPKYLKIVLSDKTVQGTVKSYNEEDGEIEISGEENNGIFPVSGSNYFKNNDSIPQAGKSGVLLIDAEGGAVCIQTGKSTLKYGYIMKVYYDENDDMPEKMRFFTTGGKTLTYDIADNFKINGIRYKNGEKYRTAIEDSAKMINPGFTCQQVMKYMLDETDEENTKITEIQLVTQPIGIKGGYDKTQLNRDSDRAEYYVENDTENRLKTSYEYAAYFKPTLTITVPQEESNDSGRFSAAQISNSNGNFSADLYDVTDLVPSLMVRYANASAKEGVATYGSHVYPLMYIKSQAMIDDDGQPCLQISAASGWEILTLYSDNTEMCKGLKKGDLAYFYQFDGRVTDYTPVVWTTSGELAGERVNYKNLPNIADMDNLSLGTTGNFSYKAFGEVLSVKGSDFVVQYGPKQSDGRRSKLITSRFSHQQWMHGGVILYQEEDDGITIRQGTVNDLRPANTWGDKASKVLWVPIHGAGRQYIIFNFN